MGVERSSRIEVNKKVILWISMVCVDDCCHRVTRGPVSFSPEVSKFSCEPLSLCGSKEKPLVTILSKVELYVRTLRLKSGIFEIGSVRSPSRQFNTE